MVQPYLKPNKQVWSLYFEKAKMALKKNLDGVTANGESFEKASDNEKLSQNSSDCQRQNTRYPF